MNQFIEEWLLEAKNAGYPFWICRVMHLSDEEMKEIRARGFELEVQSAYMDGCHEYKLRKEN